jgi:hypothetical protein
MDNKFKIWKFLGALILPFLSFSLLFGIGLFIYIRLFYNFCSAPLFEEAQQTFVCFLVIILFVVQLVVSIAIMLRSKNRFVTIGFLMSISLTASVFYSPVKGRVTYKSRMLHMANWSNEYNRDKMAGYFINHHVFIGKTYKEVVADLGEPLTTRMEGKFVYPVRSFWMFELYFEQGKCVDQQLYCFGSGSKYSRSEYEKNNF